MQNTRWQYPGHVEPVIPTPRVITEPLIDKWEPEIDSKVPLRRLIAPMAAGFTEFHPLPIPVTFSLDRWYLPLSEPVRPKRRVAETLTAFHPFPIPTVPVVSMDSWEPRTVVPVRPKARPNVGSIAFNPLPIPVLTTSAAFEPMMMLPVRPPKRLNSGEEVFYPFPISVQITLDRWGQLLAVPVLPKRRVAETWTVIHPLPIPTVPAVISSMWEPHMVVPVRALERSYTDFEAFDPYPIPSVPAAPIPEYPVTVGGIPVDRTTVCEALDRGMGQDSTTGTTRTHNTGNSCTPTLGIRRRLGQ